jgi:hypothetical protein
MGRKRKAAGERRKKVTVELIKRKHSGTVTEPYKIMEEVIQTVKEHAHLRDAKIAMAWRIGKKADADGRLWLGSAKKGSDLDRAMHDQDFVILLNKEVWNSSIKEAYKVALIDHELCHCQVACDTDGQPKLDENGRKVYRIRKHDVEEFTGVVRRRGLWKDDVRKLVEQALEFEGRPLLKIAKGSEQPAKETAAEAG